MTVEEALAELGLTPPLDPERLRRTYLRTLKTRKPEVDPDGFRRLREAYELLREQAAFEAMIAAYAEAEDDATEAPSGERAAAEPPPGDAARAETRPDEEPAPALVEIVAAPVDPTAGRSVAALVEAEDLVAAAELSRERLDFALAHPGTPILIEGATTLQLILRLHEEGEARRARAITRKLRRWLETSGSEARLLGAPDAALFALERDMAELPAGFPDPVLRAFARAIREGDRRPAMAAIARVRRQESEGAAEAIRLMLLDYAPALHQAYADAFAAPARERFGPSFAIPWLAMIVVLPMLFRMCSFATKEDPPAPPAARPTVTLPYGANGSSALLISGPVAAAVAPALHISYTATELKAPEVAEQARALAATLGTAQCDEAISAFKTFHGVLVGSTTPNRRATLAVEIDLLRRTIAGACAMSPKDLP